MDFSERGRGEFVRITGSREYREVEQEMALFDLKAERLKKKSINLVLSRSIPAGEEADVGRAIDILLDEGDP